MEPISCDPEVLEQVSEEKPIGAGLDFTSPDSPLAPYYLRTSDVLGVLLLCLMFVVLSLVPLWHTDVWGHLQSGRWIVSHGPWPQGDQFCAHADKQSTFGSVCWLSQAGLYLIFHAGELVGGPGQEQQLQMGVELLQTTQALLVTGRLLLLWLAFRRLSGSALTALLGLVLVTAFSLGHAGVMRPQAIGELFFALLLFLLARQPLSPKACWAIVGVLVVWANCHGSFVAGLALLGLCLLGRCWQLTGWRCWRLQPVYGDSQARSLALSLAGALVLIALLNPRGPLLFLDTWRMARHPNVLVMDEWRPLALGLNRPGAWLFAVSWLVVLLPLALTRRNYTPDRWLLLLFFGLQPLGHQRAMLWWVMISHWCAFSQAAELARSWPAWLRLPPTTPSFRKTILACGAVMLAALWLAPVRWVTGSTPLPLAQCLSPATPWRLATVLQPDPSKQATDFPELQAIFRDNYPERRFTGQIFASETLADYLLWRLPEGPPVLIYSHVHLFSVEHWRDCLQVKFGTPAWSEVLNRHEVNLVLVEAELHPQLRALLSKEEGWTVLVDEAGDSRKPYRCRVLLAVRTKPGKSATSGQS